MYVSTITPSLSPILPLPILLTASHSNLKSLYHSLSLPLALSLTTSHSLFPFFPLSLFHPSLVPVFFRNRRFYKRELLRLAKLSVSIVLYCHVSEVKAYPRDLVGNTIRFADQANCTFEWVSHRSATEAETASFSAAWSFFKLFFFYSIMAK